MSDTPTDRHDEACDVAGILDAATLSPDDAFRTELRSTLAAEAADGSATVLMSNEQRGARTPWPLVAAAAAVIALVVTLAIVAARDTNERLEPADPPAPELPAALDVNALRNDDLADELLGRRWFALERFDDPSPTALVSTVDFVAGPDGLALDGHDGCRPYGGVVTFEGASIGDADFEQADIVCDVDELQIRPGDAIELVTGADTFVLRAGDGTPLARFVDTSTLPPVEPEAIPFSWFVDDLRFIDFTDTGRAAMGCTLFTWTEAGGRIEFGLDERQPDCSVVEGGSEFDDDQKIAEALADVAVDGAQILRSGDMLVIAGQRRAVMLRSMPPVEADPLGVTIAAGAIFGLEPGLGVTPEQFIAAAAPVLGPPDLDTGWIPERDQRLERPVPNCDLADYRELVWGDLVAGFWGRGSRTALDHWYVGDPGILDGPKPAVDRPDGNPSPLGTEHGVAIGDSGAGIPDEFHINRSDNNGDRFPPGAKVERVIVLSANPDATRANVERGTRRGTYLVIDGVVVAYGNEAFAC